MLHNTKNINFDKEGYAQLSKRPVAVVSGVSNFETLVSLCFLKDGSSSGYFAMTAARPFSFSLDGSAPTDLYNATGRVGDIKNDGIIWYNRWYISQDTSFSNYTLSTTTWVTGQGTLTTSVPHPMCIMESLNNLAIGNGNQVLLYSSAAANSHALQATLTIPSNFEVRWIRYNNQNLYIGTKNKSGGEAVMFVWNGTGTAAQQAWPVPGANWIWSGTPYKSSIAVTTSRGQLLRFNGGGWDTLANFPVYYSTYSWFQGQGYINGRMEQRGMIADGDIIYLVIDGFVGDANVFLDNQPSGLWVYDPQVGLVHKASPSLDSYQKITLSSVNTTTDVITATGTFTPLTGVKIFYHSDTTVVGGLKNNKYYFLIRASSTTFKVATSYANAIAGTAIDLTSGGSGTQTFNCSNELDAGIHLDVSLEPGAVCLVSELDGNPITYGYMTGSQVLFGMANMNKVDSGTVDTVQSIAPSYNRGYFVTQKIFSSEILERWKRITSKFSRLFQTSDKVIIKYRMIDKLYYPVFQQNGQTDSCTWVSGTQFTSSANLASVVAGEEVEFTAGRACGLLAHISTISVSAGTYTVTLEETIPGVVAADVSGFAVNNWTKLDTIISTSGNWMSDLQTVLNGKWIQFKVELRGHSEPLTEEMRVVNTSKIDP